MVPDRSSEDATIRISRHEGNLALPVKHIADLFPIDKVGGVVNRHSGEILEGGIDYVIVVSDPTDRRIRMIPRNDRIVDLQVAVLGKRNRQREKGN